MSELIGLLIGFSFVLGLLDLSAIRSSRNRGTFTRDFTKGTDAWRFQNPEEGA